MLETGHGNREIISKLVIVTRGCDSQINEADLTIIYMYNDRDFIQRRTDLSGISPPTIWALSFPEEPQWAARPPDNHLNGFLDDTCCRLCGKLVLFWIPLLWPTDMDGSTNSEWVCQQSGLNSNDSLCWFVDSLNYTHTHWDLQL